MAGAAPAGSQTGQATPAAATGASYVLYASPTSRKLFERDALDLKARVNRWRDLVRARGASFAIATHPAQLAELPPAAALIVPSAVALNDEERRVIAQRVDSGEGLLATWMPGTLDAKGAPAAGGFIEQVFKVATRPAPSDDRGFLVTVGDTPLTYALPAGTRLWVGRDKRYNTPLLATPGAGYLADWSRAAGETGLLTFGTVERSRRVLLGWPETAWEGQPAEFTRLANLALDWVEGRPIAYARSWPFPYRGAMTIGVDALWRFENVPRIAELLSRHNVHASFHFLPADAGTNAALIRDLVRSTHSVGGFGDAARPFAGQPEAEQRARVERMVAGFRSSLGPDFVVSGLRAPQGATDAATEKAAGDLDYIVDAGRIDSATPVLSDNRRVVMLSASTNFDTRSSADAIRSGLAAAKMRAQLLGGYAFVGVDGAGFTRDSPLESELDRFVEAASRDAKPLWAASAADVAHWWRERERLKVASAWDAKDSVLTLDVTIGERLDHPVAIALVPPPSKKTVRLEDALPGVQVRADADGASVVVLTGLAPGEQRLRLRFLP